MVSVTILILSSAFHFVWLAMSQTTLADTFLDDLDELGDDYSDSGSSVEDAGDDMSGELPTPAAGGSDDDDEAADLDDILETLGGGVGVRTVSKLRVSARFQAHMRGVEAALAAPRAGMFLLGALNVLKYTKAECVRPLNCCRALQRGGPGGLTPMLAAFCCHSSHKQVVSSPTVLALYSHSAACSFFISS
jgi:hypothetical protein